MNIQITPEFKWFVEQSVQDRYYKTPREAMKKVVHLLQQKVTETERKKAKGRTMIEEGMKGPFKPVDTERDYAPPGVLAFPIR